MIKIKNRIVTSLLTVVFILSILILSLMPVLYVEAQNDEPGEEKPVTEKAERIDEKNVVEGIAVYKLQPIPEYVRIGNQTINTTDVLSAESALKESKLEEEIKWTEEEQELLALADQIRAINQPRMHATVRLPDTVTPTFSGASNELLANLKTKGIDYVYSYVWVDGAEKAQGEIVIPDHYRLKRVFATKGDKNNPKVIDVPEYQEGAKRPYYIRDVGKTITIYVDGFSGGGGESEGSSVATIGPDQDYDIIHTLSFNTSSGTCRIRLYRGSSTPYTGTVYYRAGTSGNWTSLSVSGSATTFPITTTTMQVAHNWNKSSNNYMTASFYGETKLTGIAISQKAVLSGAMGNYFMYYYARDCSNLTSLAVPDTSGLTSVGNYFMYYYAQDCSNLTSLAVPDTSGLTSVGNYFMYSYAYYSNLTSLAVPDTSGLTSVGDNFMAYYAYNCLNLTSLAVPDTSVLTSVGTNFMRYYAYGCNSLTELVLPKVGWFATHDVNWYVPSNRLGILKGYTLKYADLAGWKALTASGKTLYINYIRDANDVMYYNPQMAVINPEQEYDIIHTLTFAQASGTCHIVLYRGSTSAYSGTVYYRAGTSGNWTSLSVLGTTTTFPITATTMQVGYNWNKLGNNYMTASFQNTTTITSIAISQKAVLSGVMGNYFMIYYAYGCSSLTSLAVPNTSGLTSVGTYFMSQYAYGCSSLTSLAVPNTSGLTSVGGNFMYNYAYGCNSLTELVLPKVGWFATHDVSWGVPSSRLGYLQGVVLDFADWAGWRALTASGRTLYINYIRDPDDVISVDVPDVSTEVSPTSKDFGILDTSATSSTAINFFEIENTGSVAIDIEISGTDLTGGGDTWTLSDTATPGENTYGLKAGLDDADDTFDIIVKKTASYNILVENLAEGSTQSWGLQILMPTSVTNYEGQEMSGTITLIVSAH